MAVWAPSTASAVCQWFQKSGKEKRQGEEGMAGYRGRYLQEMGIVIR